VVRNSNKLTTLLTTSNEITREQIASHLTIITGDVRNPKDIKDLLFPEVTGVTIKAVEIIVSGIGSVPAFEGWNPIPKIVDPTVCEDGMKVILDVLRENSTPGATGPHLVTIGTTGISKLGRDYPLLLLPVYKWLLHVPHQDKGKMEAQVSDALKSSASNESGDGGKAEGVLGRYTIIHASLLTDGKMLGIEKVRSKVEDELWSGEAIGYTISRRDVGNWIFEGVIKGYGREANGNRGRIARITY